MAREAKRLTAKTAAALTDSGRHADGEGLYLVVLPGGAKNWVFMFRWGAAGKNKRVEMGLGRYPDIGLADARQRAAEARRLIQDGINPLDARREAEAKAAAERAAPGKPTFGAFADDLVKSVSTGFRNEKHRAQWASTLKEYGAPIRGKFLDEITTVDVLECLQPIWTEKAETASRVRGRIERVLDAAKARGLRSGENPARWRGHLDALLPKRQKLQRGHHKALPYAEVPAFVAQLRALGSVSALALEWTILAAARTGETTGALVPEIDRDAKVWTIPGTRMKAGREHTVPLTDRMIEILDAADKVRGESRYLFPGNSPRSPLSGMAMAMLLRRLKVDATAHGFRSSFRDWAGNETSFPAELAEGALAHTLRNAVEAAYRRDTALERRRKMMTAWANYLDKPAGHNVRALRKASA